MTKFVITETLWSSISFKTIMVSLHRGRFVVVHRCSSLPIDPKNFSRGANFYHFKATTVKFGVRLRTWDTLPMLNFVKKQELSYRKQIARQLRTQFVEGISVTLKSTLRVNQGHWKQNHWTDHTRLTSRWVIGRWILSWPWNVGQRSFNVIESGIIWKFGYGFPTFPTLTLTLTLGLGVKAIENGAVR